MNDQIELITQSLTFEPHPSAFVLFSLPNDIFWNPVHTLAPPLTLLSFFLPTPSSPHHLASQLIPLSLNYCIQINDTIFELDWLR